VAGGGGRLPSKKHKRLGLQGHDPARLMRFEGPQGQRGPSQEVLAGE
jgi:hypothetical protein